MEKLDVCPITLFKFKADPSLTDKVLNEVKALNYVENKFNLISAELYYNKELLEWFDLCVEQVRLQKYPNVEKCVITSCWVNKTHKLHQHHEHSHPNSLISGIFYLTTHNSGETVFINKDKWQELNNSLITFSNPPNLENLTKVSPSAGTLILFPSNLKHRASVLKMSEDVRFTISFNTFLTGLVDIVTDQVDQGYKTINQLYLKTEDYRNNFLPTKDS